MGLMLGDFVDDYTVRVVDVFAMPQLASNASVEAVDPVYQQQFMDLLKQTGRCAAAGARGRRRDPRPSLSPLPQAGDRRRVVPLPPGLGMLALWRRYEHATGARPATLAAAGPTRPATRHAPGPRSHALPRPVSRAQSFEQLHPRCVAVVVDPVQSVRGKVIMDAFRLISPQRLMMRLEPRQTTSVVGHLKKPSIQALVHGLNRHYYSMVVSTHKNDLDDKMLLNLHRPNWAKGLHPTDFAKHTDQNREELEVRAVSRRAPRWRLPPRHAALTLVTSPPPHTRKWRPWSPSTTSASRTRRART